MNNYIPFLKLKQNEIFAIKELNSKLRQSLTPFLDFPRNDDHDAAGFVKEAEARHRSVQRNISDVRYCYLDNYDIDSSLTIKGRNSYAYLLDLFSDLPVVPVVSIDRSDDHIAAVREANKMGKLQFDIVALRFTVNDFNDFRVIEKDIALKLGATLETFSEIHLILDCRVCYRSDAKRLAVNICNFVRAFTKLYATIKVIVAGSSIPPSISDILGVQSERELRRTELDIYSQVCTELKDDYNLFLGDYGAISPDYSSIDIMPGAMLNITAPKIIYPFDSSQFFIRGGALRTHARGFDQYFDLAATIVGKSFYRGAGYSFGDGYLEEKSMRLGSRSTPSTIIKPGVNLHITYMLEGYI